MPPVRTMSALKPVKTERTHEENQERAYIAASRRSDRSLEARVESARRASEIHKRRTGRSLRVTEQDVVNEEMYEEEDDDLPMQYRRLTAHLQTQNAYFDRRVNAYITSQMAMRQAMGQAVADQWQANNQQNPAMFMNPGMMQAQQPWYQNPMMLPPDLANRPSQSFRQTPYPMHGNTQGMTHGQHVRANSIATPQELTTFHQPHSLSTQTSPVDNASFDDRRMSLPVGVALPQTPVSTSGKLSASPRQLSPTASRTGSQHSNSAVTTPQAYWKQPSGSPKQIATPPTQSQPPMTSPFDQSFNNMMNHFNPLTPTLPMETQQMLGFNMTDPTTNMFSNNAQNTKSQQPFYSYNPNGKRKGSNGAQSGADTGLNQTLAPSSIDTSVGGFNPSVFSNTPQSGATDMLNSPFTSAGMYNYDNSFTMDQFKPSHSVGHSSGQVTPGVSNEDIGNWADFFDYGDSSQTTA